MGSYHLMRLFGIVLLLGATLAAVILMGSGRLILAVVAWGTVAAGLYIAVIGDKGIERSKVDAAHKLKNAALNFNDSSFSSNLRWIRALFFILLFSAFGAFGLIVCPALFLQKKYLGALVLLCLDVIIISSLVSFLLTAWIAYRDGLLVRMDTFGIALWGKLPISWKLIDGIDLKEIEVKGRKQFQLVLAIKAEYFPSNQSSGKLSFLHWTAPRLTPSTRTLTVPCALLNADPQLITQAAKVIADRFGSRRIKDWRHFVSIDEAIAHHDARVDIETSDHETQRLLARLNALSERSDANPDEIMDISHKLEISLQRTTALGSVHLEEIGSQMVRMNAHFVKAKWAIGLVFALGMVAIVWKIASALAR